MGSDRGGIRIGISGWQYDGWRGDFYPEELAHDDELAYALRRFPTVEVNGTFYSLKKRSDFAGWRDAVDGVDAVGSRPGGVPVFALKGSRYITHMKRLKDPASGLANFFGQGLLVLGDALGPVLWQLRDDFAFDADRLEPFLAALPGTHEAAARLARRHDDRVAEAATEARTSGPIRHAVEARHESFADPEALALLREHDVALVVSHNPGEFPVLEELTTDFMYVRLHGPETLYHGSYSDAALDRWADRVDGWARGTPVDDTSGSSRTDGPRDVYVYFDNDADGAAPFDARRLMERLDLAAPFAPPGTKDAMP
ncbi:MAG: DUF72 domain-containing protein [Longimicrobiales bacterium]